MPFGRFVVSGPGRDLLSQGRCGQKPIFQLKQQTLDAVQWCIIFELGGWFPGPHSPDVWHRAAPRRKALETHLLPSQPTAKALREPHT